MTARSMRAARGAAATAVAVVLGSVSHTVGGGIAPTPLLMLAVAVLAWPLATALTGSRERPLGAAQRRLRTAGLAATVAVSQLLLHAVFGMVGTGTVGTGTVGTGAAAPGGLVFGHVHGSLLPFADSPSPTAAPAVDAAMIGCHLAAALVAFALLRHGEAVLARIAAWVATVTSRAITASPRPRIRAGAATGARAPIWRLAVALSSLSRRGPPRLSRGAIAA